MKIEIFLTSGFKRDLKKHHLVLMSHSWNEILYSLLNNLPILSQYHCHPLQGEWKGCMDCHVQPDLILIYEKTNTHLIFHRLESHSNLF